MKNLNIEIDNIDETLLDVFGDEIIDIMLESKSDERTIKSQLARLYLHMIKSQCQKIRDVQSASWVDSCINACNILNNECQNTTIKNKITVEIQNKYYKSAAEKAKIETKNNLTTQIPSIRPSDWTLDRLCDLNYIIKFMRDNIVSGSSADEQLTSKYNK